MNEKQETELKGLILIQDVLTPRYLPMTIDLMHTVVGVVFLTVWAVVGQVSFLKR